MRSLAVALVVASFTAGCGMKAAPESAAAPPSPELRAAGSAASSRSEQPMWAVRVFDEKPQWLAAHPPLAKSEPGAWGVELQLAVEKALDAKGAQAQSLPKGVTQEQVAELFKQGLNYLVEGTMTELVAGDVDGQKGATLKVSYRLKRRLGEDTRVVQARSFTAGTKTTAVDEAALRALIPLIAEKIADAVVADVPADLLAVRG